MRASARFGAAGQGGVRTVSSSEFVLPGSAAPPARRCRSCSSAPCARAAATTAGSPQRRNGLIARSRAIVDGSVGLPRRAQRLAVCGCAGDVVVAGLDGLREAQVGQRVLVAAADPVSRPAARASLPQRAVHLRRRCLRRGLPQPAENSVSPQKSSRLARAASGEVSDVTGGVGRDVDHVEDAGRAPRPWSPSPRPMHGCGNASRVAGP